MILRGIGLLAAALALGGGVQPERVELIIRGGTIYTGEAAPFTGDVAVKGDRIRAVGPRLSYRASKVIDARGMIVAPGFIDPHTHAGNDLASDDARTRLVP